MQDQKEKVALGSIVASGALTVGKAVVGFASGSLAILSEAAHSLIDLGATVMTYFAVRISGKPADAEHHYGHGKVESISALAETALLFVLSGVVIWEATQRLIGGHATRGRSDRRRVRASSSFRSWSISSARACSTGWRTKPRAKRWKPTRCISAPTCGRRSRCCSGSAGLRSACNGRTRRRRSSSRCSCAWPAGGSAGAPSTRSPTPRRRAPPKSCAASPRACAAWSRSSACARGRWATSCSSRSTWR